MRKFSGVVSALLCAVLAAACVIPGKALVRVETKTKGLNIMLVVDDTVSMQGNDPNHIASVALQQFTDIIPSEGSYVAMATYDDDILTKVPENEAMLHIRTQEDKNVLKRFAETGLTQDGRFTDLPKALAYALAQVSAVQDTENKPVIIAVSDGENDYLNAEAKSRSEEYLDKVRNAGVPVYLMVINASNESGVRDYMEGIAADTGGEAYFIQSGDEIGVRLNALAMELYDYIIDEDQKLDIQVAPGQPQTWPVTVEDGVFEAVLQLDHATQLEMELLGPDGAQIPLSGSGGVVTTTLPNQGAMQTSIRLIEPEPGRYQLKLSSPAQQLVVGRVILNEEIYIQVEASPNPAQPGRGVNVSAKLMRGNEQYTDLEFVDLTASVSVDGGAAVGMDKDTVGDCFRTELDLSAEGSHELVVSVQGQRGFYRSSDPLELVVNAASDPTPPSPTDTLSPNEEISIRVEASPNPAEPGQSVKVSAKLMRGSEPYTGLEFADLTASVSVDGGAAVDMDKDEAGKCFRTELDLSAEGSHQLVVRVQDQGSFSRSSSPLELVVNAHSGPGLLIIIAAVAALVVIAAAVAVILLRRKPRSQYIRLQGTLTVTYLDDMHQYIWERYVQPGRYYSPRSPASLGRMLRDQPNSGDIPAFFDQLLVAGVQYGPGQIAVEITGEFTGGTRVNSRIQVFTGAVSDEFDSFDGPASTLIIFPDGTQTELDFTVG